MNKKVNDLKLMVTKILNNRKDTFLFKKFALESTLEFDEDLFSSTLYEEYFLHMVSGVTDLKDEVNSENGIQFEHLDFIES